MPVGVPESRELDYILGSDIAGSPDAEVNVRILHARLTARRAGG